MIMVEWMTPSANVYIVLGVDKRDIKIVLNRKNESWQHFKFKGKGGAFDVETT